MADDWDDDDFGTFESATDVKSSTTSETSIASTLSTPAWLLAAQQTTQAEKVPQTENTKESAKLSAIGNYQAEVTPATATLSDFSAFCLDETSQETLPRSSVNQNEIFSTTSWDALKVEGSNDFTNVKIEPKTQIHLPSLSGDASFEDILKTTPPPLLVMKTQTQVDPVPISVPSIPTTDASTQAVDERETNVIVELRSRLDTALALKEHTEKSLEELKQELSRILNETKEDHEKKEEKHQHELTRLKEEQEKEMNQLKEDSQKTMKLLTEEYSHLSNEAIRKQKNEYEKSLEDILEKCVGVLEQQSEMLSRRVEETTNSQKTEITDVVTNCKDELKDLVSSYNKETDETYQKVKEDFEKQLQERIADEFESQRKIDDKCKRDAMSELSQIFKARIEETFQEERKKNAEATRAAVEEARRSILESVQQEQKNHAITRERHLLALKLLLTSSQEHLRNLTNDIPSMSTKNENS